MWREPQQKIYVALKTQLMSKPILRLPESTSTFVLRTDASNKGIGAVLLQYNKDKLFPVGYYSRKLSERESKYSTIEEECLVIVWAVRKLQIYLYGR